MKKAYFLTTGLLILAIFAVAYYNQAQQNGKTFTIGSILILSGDGASWGEAAKNGIELALHEINNAGGVNGKTLKVVYEDSQADAAKSINAFLKLTEADHVHFIIGPSWSVTGLPLVDLAKQNKVVMISPSLGVKDFNEANDYLFNTWPHDSILSQNLANYVYKQGKRNVAILGAKEVWVNDQTQNFKNRFVSLGGKIRFISEPSVTDTDIRTDILKIKNDKSIDAIIMTTDGYSLTVLNAKKLKQLGVHLPIYSVTLDGKIISDCGNACEGTIFLSFLTPTKTFEQLYRNSYNREVEIGADSAYDAIKILAEAMNKTNSFNPDTVKDYLAKIKSFDGASGNLISDGKRGFTKNFVIEQIKKEAAVQISH